MVTGDGSPVGVVSEQAVFATPDERRPWVSVGSLARSLEQGLLLSADLSGESLVRAMQDTPAGEYVLVDSDGSVVGLLVSADVDAAFIRA